MKKGLELQEAKGLLTQSFSSPLLNYQAHIDKEGNWHSWFYEKEYIPKLKEKKISPIECKTPTYAKHYTENLSRVISAHNNKVDNTIRLWSDYKNVLDSVNQFDHYLESTLKRYKVHPGKTSCYQISSCQM